MKPAGVAVTYGFVSRPGAARGFHAVYRSRLNKPPKVECSGLNFAPHTFIIMYRLGSDTAHTGSDRRTLSKPATED